MPIIPTCKKGPRSTSVLRARRIAAPLAMPVATRRVARGARSIAAATAMLCAASLATAGDLTVNIRNLRGSAGTVYVALFDKAANFPKAETSIAGQYLPVRGATVSAAFLNLKPGQYALSIYQDENGNGKLDTNLLGVPVEPYGFSRDASGTLGPPTFDAAALEITGNLTVDVNLH